MKRSWTSLVIALVALAVASPTLQAQGGSHLTGGRRGARMMEMLMKDISLDDAQKAKIEAIQAKYMKEMPAMQPGSPPDEAGMTKRREMQVKQQGEMRTVLKADQQKVFDKNLAEMQERMKSRGPGN